MDIASPPRTKAFRVPTSNRTMQGVSDIFSFHQSIRGSAESFAEEPVFNRERRKSFPHAACARKN